MRLGSLELDKTVGGYEVVCEPADKLPQEVATAVSTVNAGLLGATYQPLIYVGRQVVNGVNHLFIARELRSTRKQQQMVVALVINIPAGDLTGEKTTVVNIIEETDLPADVRSAFDSATSQIVGVSYKPLAYVGSQVVKGVNHFLIRSAAPVYPGAKPRPVLVGVNTFQGMSSIMSIEDLESAGNPVKVSAEALGCPLGEWP